MAMDMVVRWQTVSRSAVAELDDHNFSTTFFPQNKKTTVSQNDFLPPAAEPAEPRRDSAATAAASPQRAHSEAGAAAK